ncbi:MAG: right-handed parallel beta-helix repeat-containing protein [bacterium]
MVLEPVGRRIRALGAAAGLRSVLTPAVWGLLVMTWALPGQARTWHVPSECPTINAANDSAAAGDTVLVGPGTYQVITPIQPGPDVCLTSEEGAEATILEICLCSNAIGLWQCEGARVSGFAIRNSPDPDCRDMFPTYGAVLYDCTDVIVEDCIIEGVGNGIDVAGSSGEWWKPAFRNNTIRSCGFGVYCTSPASDPGEPGRPYFTGNTITECVTGVYVGNSSPMFDGNEITHCRDRGMQYVGLCGGGCRANRIAYHGGNGVEVIATEALDLPHFNGGFEPRYANDIYGNSGYAISYTGVTQSDGILAEFNYWGTRCPDGTLLFQGPVDFSPWMDSTHTEILNEDDCPGATEPTSWGAVKALFK